MPITIEFSRCVFLIRQGESSGNPEGDDRRTFMELIRDMTFTKLVGKRIGKKIRA